GTKYPNFAEKPDFRVMSKCGECLMWWQKHAESREQYKVCGHSVTGRVRLHIHPKGNSMITKSNSRKSLALALGIVGVAGLSMASAASIDVDSTEIAAGSDTFLDCDADGVDVTYVNPVYTGGATDAYTIDTVNVADFSDGTCSGTVYVTLLDS